MEKLPRLVGQASWLIPRGMGSKVRGFESTKAGFLGLYLLFFCVPS